jgi:hypothetical protein
LCPIIGSLICISFITADARSSRCIIAPIQKIFFERILKICLFSRKDIAKECAKLILPILIQTHKYSFYHVSGDQCVDYGCEAVWAGYYDGIDTIPGALLKYGCIDACYYQLCSCAQFFQCDYPYELKQHSWAYALTRILVPMFIKRCIGTIIDCILDELSNCKEQENGQMLTAQDFFDE